MAKQQKKEFKQYLKNGKEYIGNTPLNTEVEVVATKGEEVVKSKMTFDDYLCLTRKPGWRYNSYQPGFCSIPEKEK